MADRQQKTALFFSTPACFATHRIIQKSPAESWDLHSTTTPLYEEKEICLGLLYFARTQ